MKSVQRLSILVTALMLTLPQVSSADPGRHDRHFSHRGHTVYRDISPWWWVIPPLVVLSTLPAYRQPAPVIIQQAPAPVMQPPAPITALPASPPYWYFCPAADTYYPYVQDCPGGWSLVPATPPASSAR